MLIVIADDAFNEKFPKMHRVVSQVKRRVANKQTRESNGKINRTKRNNNTNGETKLNKNNERGKRRNGNEI